MGKRLHKSGRIMKGSAMSNYDMNIHHNPDAKAWAEFFAQCNPDINLDEDLMLGWFANAMMAMHDHLTPRIEALQAALADAEAERDGAYDRAAEVAEKNAEDDWTDGVPQGGIIADTIRQLKSQTHD
jgi:hypothetical protein